MHVFTWYRVVVMRNNAPRNKSRLKDSSSIPEVERALAHVGIFARVAEKEGLSRSHVLMVARGHRKSSRVIQAIVREVRRIERSAERAA